MSEKDTVGLSMSETRNEKGEVIYRKRITSLNLLVQTTEKPLDALRRAQGILDIFQKVDTVPIYPAHQDEALPAAPASTALGSVASVTDDELIHELDKLHWRQNEKKTGWYAFIADVPNPFRAVLASKFAATSKKTVPLDGFNYTRFGAENQMLGKFAQKQKGTETA